MCSEEGGDEIWGEVGLAGGSGCGFGKIEGCGDLTGDCNIRFGLKGFEKWIGCITCFAGKVGKAVGRVSMTRQGATV